MRIVKKVISWVLILGMIFGMVPANNAIAAETPFVKKVLVWTPSKQSHSVMPTIVKFYNEKTNNNATSLKAHLDASSLDGVNLLWVLIPYEDFNETDITYMKAYLETGGRITFCGENNVSYKTQNTYIAAAIDKLDGDMQIIGLDHLPKTSVLTGSTQVISASKLTKGVTGYYYAAAAKLSYTGTVQPVFASSTDGAPHILDQAVGKGRITLITDINNWDPYKNKAIVPYPTEYAGSNNEVFFENLLLDSINNQAIVAKGGNPNIGFGPTGLTASTSPKDTPVEDKVKLTMESTTEAGRTYYYRVIDNNTTATNIVAGTTTIQNLNEWTLFTPSTQPEITANDGKFIEVVELDSSNIVTRSGYAGPTDDGVDKATVTFDMNYTGGIAPSPKDLNRGSTYGTYLPANGLERTGYTFDGWYKAAVGGTKVTSTDTVSDSHTLYAHWTAKTYTVSFDHNGGSGSTGPITVTFDSNYDSLPQSAGNRTGYTFDGWYTKPTGGTKITSSSPVNMAKDQTLYAQWEAKKSTVTFDFNGGTGTNPQTFEAVYGSEYGLLPTITPPDESKKFNGWYIEQQPGPATLVTSTTTVTMISDHTLKAEWSERQAYSVSYNGNGNTSGTEPESKNHYEDQDVTVLGNTGNLAKTGYDFTGWNTQADGEGTDYKENAIYTIDDSDVTLYAVWEPKSVTVSFNVNAPANTTTPVNISDKTVKYGQNYQNALGSITRPGYNFLGWFTEMTLPESLIWDAQADNKQEAEANKEIDKWDTSNIDKYKVDSTTGVTNEAAHTLFAQWVAKIFKITYEKNGGTLVDAVSGATAIYDKKYGQIKDVTRAGYTFDGWYTTSTYEAGTDVTNTTTVSSTTAPTLYAKWTANTDTHYAVEHYMQAVTGEGYTLGDLEDKKGTTDTTVTVGNADAKTYEGFTENEGKRVGSGEIKGDGSLALKFYYDRDTYDVTFNSNGGSAVTKASIRYGATITNLTPPTKEGYSLEGWYEDANLTTKWDLDTDVVTEGISLNAKWTANAYTISFDANDGSGTTTPISVPFDSKYTLPSPNPDRPGYTFTGWYTEATGGTEVDADADMTTPDAHTLYAQWTANDYTISFDANDGSGTTTPTTQTVAFDSKYTLPTLVPEKAGYVFAGWYTEATGGTKVEASTILTTPSDHTLYAQWTLLPTEKEVFNPEDGPIKNDVIVLVNDKVETIGKSQESKRGTMSVTTLTADPLKLDEKLNREGTGAQLVFPVSSKSDIIVGLLDGEMVKKMENQQATFVLKTDKASYTLPAHEIDIDSISKQLGSKVELKDIKIKIEIANSTEATTKVVDSAAKDYNFETIGKPFDFKVTYESVNKTGEVERYNVYVERSVSLPEGIDPNRITTGLVVEPDGFSYHVPTRVEKDTDIRYRADINSLTNSTYTVVWHPIEFADVANHWSKNSVNDMGSRMVINGVGNGNFEPNKDITRAEFVTIMVRGLGLRPGMGDYSFSDVENTQWYADYIKTAVEYNLIKGYDDGSFKPKNTITREEAMAIIARAMKLTGLKIDYTEQELNDVYETMPDLQKIASWAKTYVGTGVKNGVVNGKENMRIAPKERLTRAEAAAMMQRLLQKSNLIN